MRLRATFQMEMSELLTRRCALGCLLTVPALASAASGHSASAKFPSRLAELERRRGGRLGVAVLDVSNGKRLEHRAQERFPLCSTFKFLAAALVLARVDSHQERLDRRILFQQADLVPYSPMTEARVGAAGATLAELCEAAVTLSDNTAGNLLLNSFEGPPALTRFARSIGDADTRLDRMETALNEALPGDPRDTTTPHAMLGNLRQLLLGHALTPGSRAQLTSWLKQSQTGAQRLRAGLNPEWTVGDKTGAGNNGTTNDIAVVWPKKGGPLLISAYSTQVPSEGGNALLAEVGSVVSAWKSAEEI